MALQKNYYEHNLDVTVENCYYRIEKVEISKRLDRNYDASVWVYIYRSKEKSLIGAPINSRLYYFENLTVNEITLEGLYNKLKSLEEYKNAVDEDVKFKNTMDTN